MAPLALPLLISYVIVGMNVSMQGMQFEQSTYNIMQRDKTLKPVSDNKVRNSQFYQIPIPILDDISKTIINEYLSSHRQNYEYGNASRNWRVLRYNHSGHFTKHQDRHRPIGGYDHIATEIYIPPLTELQFQGGQLVIWNCQKIQTLRPHATKWTHVILPLGMLHKVNTITNGTRISYTKSVYMQKKAENPKSSVQIPLDSEQL